MIRRARLLSVLLALAAGAVGTISSTQTWIHVVLGDGASADVAVAGADAIPVLAPLCLAVLALGAALSIVGRILRLVFGAITVAIAVLLFTLTLPVLTGPHVDAYAPAVTDTTGITGDSAVAALVVSTSVTAWPAVSLLVAVILAFVGIFVLITGYRWTTGGRKYDTAARRAALPADAPLDAIDSWDDLSRGTDPTTPEPPR